MTKDELKKEYFTWLYDMVCKERRSSQISYRKLLSYLYDKQFRYLLEMDGNRAEDGEDLRWRFLLEAGYQDYETQLHHVLGECNVLEMMIALAIRCEENIMDDPCIGDRTGQWFWCMVVNLGLGSMVDDRFDFDYVDDAVERFLDREYAADGSGGLFTIKNCEYDLRTIEIWHQLCWYLDSITNTSIT